MGGDRIWKTGAVACPLVVKPGLGVSQTTGRPSWFLESGFRAQEFQSRCQITGGWGQSLTQSGKEFQGLPKIVLAY